MRKLLVVGGAFVLAFALATSALYAQEATPVPNTAAQSTAPWLGISVADSNGQTVVGRVQPGSPAAAAGLVSGDIIQSFDGTAVASTADVSDALLSHAIGDTITLGILRGTETLDLDVTLTSRAQIGGQQFGRGNQAPDDPLGFAQHLLHAEITAAANGYEVTAVDAVRNPFGLQMGDVVVSINGQAVADFDPQTLHDDAAAAGAPTLSLVVERNGEQVTLQADATLFEGGRQGGHRGHDGGFEGRGGDFGSRGGDFGGRGNVDPNAPQPNPNGSVPPAPDGNDQV